MVKTVTTFLIVIVLIIGVVCGSSWCGSTDTFFYANNSTTAPTTYYQLVNYPPAADQIIPNVTVKNTDGRKLIGIFITPDGQPGVTHLSPMLWRARTYQYVSTASGTTTIEFEVWNRSISGIETGPLFYNKWISDDVNSLDPSELITSYSRRNATTLFAGDRLMIKVYGQTTHSSNVIVNFVTAGNTNASYTSTGYYDCVSAEDSAMWSEASSAAFGVVGGLVTSVLILKRRRGKEL